MNKDTNGTITIREILAVTMADIDIFLLLNEEQTADNDKECFTRQEIRKQLNSSLDAVIQALTLIGYKVDKPIKGLLQKNYLPINTKIIRKCDDTNTP